MGREAPEKRRDWIAILISIAALALSGVVAYQDYWPSSETKSIVSHAEWSMKEGPFGKGPQLLAAINFVNRGNRPIILSSIYLSFGYTPDFKAPNGCSIDGAFWSGLPWNETFDGSEVAKALPRAIAPQIATSTVYTFQVRNILPKEMVSLNERSLMTCLVYETIDSDGQVRKTRTPLGILTFSDDRILDFVLHDSSEKPVVIVP